MESELNIDFMFDEEYFPCYFSALNDVRKSSVISCPIHVFNKTIEVLFLLTDFYTKKSSFCNGRIIYVMCILPLSHVIWFE